MTSSNEKVTGDPPKLVETIASTTRVFVSQAYEVMDDTDIHVPPRQPVLANR